MTMAKVATATRQQEPPARTWSLEEQQGSYGMSTLIPGRTDMDAIVQGANWSSPIGIKGVTDRRGGGSGQWMTGHRTAEAPQPERDMIPGVCDHAPETAHTLTPDMPVSLYFRETDLLNQRLRDVLGRLKGGSSAAVSFKVPHAARSVSSEDRSFTTMPLWATFTPAAYLLATLSPPQEALVRDELSRRIAVMEETLLRFSELPENWDSYGGRAISPDAIDEARRILRVAINLNLPEPWVAPGGDAGIGIQWDTDRAELYIDVVPEEETTFALTPKAGNVDEADGVLTMDNLVGVLNQFAESAT